MSKLLTRTYSLRKHVRPMIDIDEEDDEQRRDSSGRKRVAVVHCLLESSSDEVDETQGNHGNSSNILWLTFTEISHIRRVISQTTSTFDQRCNKNLCSRCQKKINFFFFLPSFVHLNKCEVCHVCQRSMCKKCSYYNFALPSAKLLIPVRIQTLLRPSATNSELRKEQTDQTNQPTKTICRDCLQIFNEHLQTSQCRLQSPISPFRRTLSLPTRSSKSLGDMRHTRHRYRPVQVTHGRIEKTTTT